MWVALKDLGYHAGKESEQEQESAASTMLCKWEGQTSANANEVEF